MKYVIVMINMEDGIPYILHTDNKFYSTCMSIHGCKVLEYSSKKRAELAASRANAKYNYGHSYAMTMTDLFALWDLTSDTNSRDVRLARIQEYFITNNYQY